MQENERLDEVNDRIRLIQRTDGLLFGTDALLLAAFVRGKPTDSAVEFGGGCGIISLLLAARRKAATVLAVEVQAAYADLIARNAALNGLSDTVIPVCADLRKTDTYGGDGCDYLVTNPPYMKSFSGKVCDAKIKRFARQECNGGISDFTAAAAKKIRFGGRFFCVYRADRMSDLICSLRTSGIEPKRLTTVHADGHSAPVLILLEGRMGGAPGMTVTRPLFLYSDRTHTENSDDMKTILGTGRFPSMEDTHAKNT